MRIVLCLLGEELRSVGVVMLRACLRGERRFYSLGICQFQRTVNLVGRDMVEALSIVSFRTALPIFLCGLEQRQRTYYVCICESKRVFYAPVNVALGCKVDYPVNVVLLHQRLHRFIIADVRLYKRIILLALDVLQVCQISCIRQLVEVDNVVFGVFVYEQSYNVRAYKTRSAGYDDVSLVFHDFCIVKLSIKSCFVKDDLSACNSRPFVLQYVPFYNAICCLLEYIPYIVGFQHVKKNDDVYAFNAPILSMHFLNESVQ